MIFVPFDLPDNTYDKSDSVNILQHKNYAAVIDINFVHLYM